MEMHYSRSWTCTLRDPCGGWEVSSMMADDVVIILLTPTFFPRETRYTLGGMFSDCLLIHFLYPELFFMPQQTHSHSSAAFCPHSSWNSSSSFYFHSSHPRSSLSLTWKTQCFQGLSSPWCSVSGCLQCPALAAHSYPSLALKRPLRASMWSEVASALEASTQVLKHSFS